MAKIGDKFVLVVEEIYDSDIHKKQISPAKLYRMKGFNTLVFDENGIQKLEKFKEPTNDIDSDSLEIGFCHGATSMFNSVQGFINMFMIMDNDKLLEYFGVDSEWGDSVLQKIFEELTPKEFMDKVDRYYERIIIGDEIRNVHTQDTMYVIYIDFDPRDKMYYYYGMADSKGDETFVNFVKWGKDEIVKTGKHNEIVEKGLVQAFTEILKDGE